jgi:hypothetical protein
MQFLYFIFEHCVELNRDWDDVMHILSGKPFNDVKSHLDYTLFLPEDPSKANSALRALMFSSYWTTLFHHLGILPEMVFPRNKENLEFYVLKSMSEYKCARIAGFFEGNRMLKNIPEGSMFCNPRIFLMMDLISFRITNNSRSKTKTGNKMVDVVLSETSKSRVVGDKNKDLVAEGNSNGLMEIDEAGIVEVDKTPSNGLMEVDKAPSNSLSLELEKSGRTGGKEIKKRNRQHRKRKSKPKSKTVISDSDNEDLGSGNKSNIDIGDRSDQSSGATMGEELEKKPHIDSSKTGMGSGEDSDIDINDICDRSREDPVTAFVRDRNHVFLFLALTKYNRQYLTTSDREGQLVKKHIKPQAMLGIARLLGNIIANTGVITAAQDPLFVTKISDMISHSAKEHRESWKESEGEEIFKRSTRIFQHLFGNESDVQSLDVETAGGILRTYLDESCGRSEEEGILGHLPES